MKIMADVMASNFLERRPSVAKKGGPRNSSSHVPTMQPSLIINNQWMRQEYKAKKLQYLLWGKTWKEKFKISFYPGTTETMKGRILKAIEKQNQLGLIVTLRGYLGKGWKVRFTIQRKIGNQQKRCATVGLQRQYINFGYHWSMEAKIETRCFIMGKTTRFPNRNMMKKISSTKAEKEKHPGEMFIYYSEQR